MKKFSTIAVCTLAVAALAASPAMANKFRRHHWKPKKNIIFMVPDGMGLSNTTAARIFKNGPNGARLYFETLDNIGYQSTHSANSTVTDSAAAASAWAIGEKCNNGEISCHGNPDGTCSNLKKTILEIAEEKGLATGLVATSQISHATPAAFGAHTISRNCGAEIARQYIEETDVEVILGGGVYKTNSYCDVYPESFAAPDKTQYIVDKALANGYVYAKTKTEMNEAVAGGVDKVLGMFTSGGKTVEHFHVDGSPYPAEEPTLAEMTAAALDILEEDKDGLFLLVEGSQIDWEDHGNRIDGTICETLGFDAAVKVVLDWVNAKPMRKLTTQIIVVADHDTGGMGINGPYGALSEAGEIIEDGWTSGGHTAADTIIYSQGPMTWKLNKAMDNTDLYDVMKKFLKH
jgi:alkaline phosphatase